MSKFLVLFPQLLSLIFRFFDYMRDKRNQDIGRKEAIQEGEAAAKMGEAIAKDARQEARDKVRREPKLLREDDGFKRLGK